jgi:transcriptional regulator with PAS, ATPase and Fis domain
VKYLTNYNWPGNVRKLNHFVERLTVTISSDQIKPDHLPDNIVFARHDQKETTFSINKNYLYSLLQDTEREIIFSSYRKLKSSYKVASELIISQSSAIRKIRRYTKQA